MRDVWGEPGPSQRVCDVSGDGLEDALGSAG